MLETLPQQLVNGIIIGSVYGLLALGLTMVFGLMSILNIAHGEFITLGGMMAWIITTELGLPWYLGLLSAMVVGGIAGLLAERLLFRRVAGNAFSGLIVAFGLSYVIQGIAFWVWQGVPRYTAPPLSGVFDVGIIALSQQRVLVFVITIACFLGLFYFLKRTKMGKGIRATAQNPIAAQLMGISPSLTYPAVLIVSSALGGIAGALLGTLLAMGPFTGAGVIIKGFIVVVLGGMGYVPGAMLGGLLLGMVETLGAAFLSSAFKDGYGFILMILILWLRPNGLFGAKEVI